MKTHFKTLFKTALAVVALGGLAVALQPTTAQAGPADDQVSLYLGSLMLNLGTDIGALSNQERAAALVTGRNAFRSNTRREQPLAVGASFPTGGVQGAAFQALVLEATELALADPNTVAIPRTAVPMTNGRSVNVVATLDPTRIRASQITTFVIRRMPQMAPLLSQQGVAAAFSTVTSTPYVPVFNYRGRDASAIQLAQLKDAAKLASGNLKAGLKTYPRGTVNVPSTQLLDFRLGTNQALIAKFTAGIAANAMMVIPDDLDISGSGINYDRSTSLMANSLVKAANGLMRVSSNSSIPGVAVGSIYAVTGENNDLWNHPTPTPEQSLVTAALNGVVYGAVTGAKRFVNNIAFSVAAAFSGTFAANGGLGFDTTANRQAIYNVIAFAMRRVNATQEAQIRTQIDEGFAAGLGGPSGIATIPGSAGVNGLVYDNGAPLPVTDIVGS